MCGTKMKTKIFIQKTFKLDLRNRCRISMGFTPIQIYKCNQNTINHFDTRETKKIRFLTLFSKPFRTYPHKNFSVLTQELII